MNDFIRLNEEWITTYFELEAADKNLANNPYKIVENGGYIFTLQVDESVIGACALFNTGDNVYELARMAVSPNSQGKGYGRQLMQHALSKLSDIKAKKTYLVSNTRLESAITLYKQFGFKTTHEGPHPLYNRANIVMELEM